MDTTPLDAHPLLKSALPLVGLLLWEAWLGATKRVAANSTLGLVLSLLTALWGAVAKAKAPPAALLLLAVLLGGCATAQGHYVTIPPDPSACAQAVLRAAKAQLPCDKSPPPPAEEIAACTLAAAAELLPCSPKVTWVADAEKQVSDTIEARVASLESTVGTLKVDQKEDHDELRELREGLLGINFKLDAIRKAVDDAMRSAADNDPEARLRALEDWRTTVVAKLGVILAIAAIVSSIGTALAIKWLSGASVPPARIAPLDYNGLPVDRDGSPKWPVR